MTAFHATGNDSGGTADRPSEGDLDFLRRIELEGPGFEFSEAGSLRERRVRILDLEILDELLGNTPVERIEKLVCLRDELAGSPIDTGSSEGAE